MAQMFTSKKLTTILILGFGVAAPAFQTRKISSREGFCASMSKDDMCGEGFYKQTGPDGDYCVFDYEAVAKKFGTDHDHQVEDAEHYWEQLEKQNKARKKFGLRELSPEEFVALQVQSKEIGAQKVADATLEAFGDFDKNGDGVITLKEFRQGLESSKMLRGDDVSEILIKKLFEFYDTSGDGLLQPDEFVTLDRLRSQLDHMVKEENEEEESTSGAPQMFKNFLQNLAFQFQDTCESNQDCQRPEVCCDFGYKKMCCSSGKMAKDLQLEYAMVPVPQQH